MLDFPENKIEWALFRGIEQEGHYRGEHVLFVVGDAPIEKICSALYDFKLHHVYFGAGGRFDYNPETVKAVWLLRHSIYRILKIGIESPLYEDTLHKSFGDVSDVYWVIPFIWYGQTLPEGIESLLRVDSRFEVYAKIDTGKAVLLQPIVDLVANSYVEGYSSDKLIHQKER